MVNAPLEIRAGESERSLNCTEVPAGATSLDTRRLSGAGAVCADARKQGSVRMPQARKYENQIGKAVFFGTVRGWAIRGSTSPPRPRDCNPKPRYRTMFLL